MKRHQINRLAWLVFKRGGVAGAVRRIIYRWQGIFTASHIYSKLVRKYPWRVSPDGR